MDDAGSQIERSRCFNAVSTNLFMVGLARTYSMYINYVSILIVLLYTDIYKHRTIYLLFCRLSIALLY
jgi:hypothetical protein